MVNCRFGQFLPPARCDWQPLNTTNTAPSIEGVEWDWSGKFVAGTSSNEAIVFNPDNGEYNVVFSGADEVSGVLLGAISWHPSEAVLAVATQNAVLLWDVETDQQINSLPSSILVKWLSPDLLLTASDNAFQIRDLRADTVVRAMEPNFQLDRLIGFSANGRYLATTFFWREEVYLTDLATGAELPPLTGTDFDLSSLEWNPSGTVAAIGRGI
jgi:WD40 repeat protein